MTKPQEIEGFTLAKLISVAQKNVEEKTKNSKVLSVEAEECIPKFETNGASALHFLHRYCLAAAVVVAVVNRKRRVDMLGFIVALVVHATTGVLRLR